MYTGKAGIPPARACWLRSPPLSLAQAFRPSPGLFPRGVTAEFGFEPLLPPRVHGPCRIRSRCRLRPCILTQSSAHIRLICSQPRLLRRRRAPEFCLEPLFLPGVRWPRGIISRCVRSRSVFAQSSTCIRPISPLPGFFHRGIAAIFRFEPLLPPRVAPLRQANCGQQSACQGKRD